MTAELEPHFTIAQVAEAWGISVRSIFRDQPGVADIAVRHSLTSRSYQVLRIPASVVARASR
jgi:hypothetical protein